ncbi:UNVERIFIED_CONTAM: hypothetical protein PYX00_009838 [Menopon gallinae]|uniref:Dymeclin n=1 Tax=Menopon gallinae TaxID=328185 RepID=A0AAW2HCV3_9NEOP
MGSLVSKDLFSNEYLIKFSGKDHISPVDPFWSVFLSFSFNPPSSRSENELLDSKLLPIFDKLAVNNLTSGNFVSLIQVFLNKAADILVANSNANDILLWQSYNAIFIIRCFTKYLVETVSESKVLKHFQVRPVQAGTPVVDHKVEDFPDNPVEVFLETLIEILVDVNLENRTYNLHLEAINCLIVLLSIQMYTQKPAAKSVVYKNIMHGRPSIHSPLLVKNLLSHYVNQEKLPDTSGGSIVIGLASGLWQMLTLGYRGHSDNQEGVAKGSSLANQSLLLILILVNHCTAEKNLRNPYREVLFTFPNNSQGPNQEVPVSTVSTFKFNLDQLYSTLCNTANNECCTLLLYLLLHRNDNVKNVILARADLELLVVPILKTLYNVTDNDSHHIYMSLIILLILSEDTWFSRTVHQISLKNVTWYSERALSDVTLGGLLVLVFIRTIHYNMLKMRDKYLHTNCLAALANMSNNFSNLHSYVSQRLISLFETLARKYHRLENELRLKKEVMSKKKNEVRKVSNVSKPESQHDGSTGSRPENANDRKQSVNATVTQKEGGDVIITVNNHVEQQTKESDNLDTNIDMDDLDETADLVQDLNVLEEVLRMVLEIINSCLSNQLQHNPNLIYALLYKKNVFDPFRNHPNFQDIVENVDIVINYFSNKLEQVQTDLSVDEVLSTITQGTLMWPSHKLKKFPDLKFKYVEEEQPEDFFIPYVWSLVGQHSGISWNANNKKVFFSENEM